MKKLIIYTSGGLCNRLRPISSSMRLAEMLERELWIFWEPDFRCPINYNELFDNKHNFIYSNDMLKLEDTSICVSEWDIKQEEVVFGRSIFRYLINKKSNNICPDGCDTVTKDIESENLILFSGYFFRQVEMIENEKYLKALRPKIDIQNRIDVISKTLNLNKDVIGMHVRGSDINVGVEEYDFQFKKYKESERVFICSDDKKYEDFFIRKYGNKIIRFDKKYYSYRVNADNKSYIDNTTMEHDGMKESLIDLYLLSKTDIKVYFKNSSFAQIALLLGKDA